MRPHRYEPMAKHAAPMRPITIDKKVMALGENPNFMNSRLNGFDNRRFT